MKAPSPAPGFQLPEPDRQLQVSSPPLLPPELEALEGEEEMAFSSLQPRKIQLQHLTLLNHPVARIFRNVLFSILCGWVRGGGLGKGKSMLRMQAARWSTLFSCF